MSQVVNFTEYFKGEDKEVYVQNVSGCQISLSFEMGPGHSVSYLIPSVKDPVDLSQSIPYSAIKNSMDFRRMLNRQPMALRLLTSEEYAEYYRGRAAAAGLPDERAAMAAAAERIKAIQDHVPLADATPPVKTSEVAKEAAVVIEAEEIHPRVLHICLQCHAQIPEHQRSTAPTVLSELELVQGELKLADFDYVLSHTPYKSVKQWVKKHIEKLVTEEVKE
jgi:hypothetical protein